MLSDKSVQEITAQAPGSTDPNRTGPAQIDTRSSVTMDAIKSYILRHGLHPGDRLPTESALCADLGVSRSSVREALRKLQALDIVTVRQGSGSYVGDMSLQPLVETLVLRAALDDINGVQSLHSIVETRHALDLGIALPLTRAMKDTSNPELWELVNTMTDHAHAGGTYFDQDIAFHSGLLAYLKNPLMHQLVAAMWLVHQSVTPQLAAASREEMEDTAEAHAAILRACEAGDVEAYAAAVDAHYEPLMAIIEGR